MSAAGYAWAHLRQYSAVTGQSPDRHGRVRGLPLWNAGAELASAQEVSGSGSGTGSGSGGRYGELDSFATVRTCSPGVRTVGVKNKSLALTRAFFVALSACWFQSCMSRRWMGSSSTQRVLTRAEISAPGSPSHPTQASMAESGYLPRLPCGVKRPVKCQIISSHPAVGPLGCFRTAIRFANLGWSGAALSMIFPYLSQRYLTLLAAARCGGAHCYLPVPSRSFFKGFDLPGRENASGILFAQVFRPIQ